MQAFQYLGECTPDVGPGQQILSSYFPFESLDTIPAEYKDLDFDKLRQIVTEQELVIMALERAVRSAGDKPMMASEREPTRAQKLFVYLRDGCQCSYCSTLLLDVDTASIDHRKSFYYDGGKTLVSNLVTACYMCNVTKGADSEEWFRENLKQGGLRWRNQEFSRQQRRFQDGR